MAILLQELTIRYSPEKGRYTQLIRDFYAMIYVWRKHGSGGAHVSPTSQRKTEIIDDVMNQVGNMLAKMTIERVGTDPDYRKDIHNVFVASQAKDWEDLRAAVEPIIKKLFGDSWFREQQKIELNPQSKFGWISKSIETLVGRPKKEPTVSTPEPVPTPKPTSAVSPSATSPVSMPSSEPKPEKLPPMPTDIPTLKPIGDGPKRLGGTYESLLSTFGYQWNETDQSYINDERGIKIQINKDNTAVATILSSGLSKTYHNLGIVFRKLVHNRNKQKSNKNEPVAQVTKEDYTKLYEFLYT